MGLNEIQKLADLLRASAPDIQLDLDCPAEPGAPCWLDVAQHGRFVAVEWRPQRGFGVSLVNTADDPRAGLFEGPDEVLGDLYVTRDRILALLEPVSRRKAAGR